MRRQCRAVHDRLIRARRPVLFLYELIGSAVPLRVIGLLPALALIACACTDRALPLPDPADHSAEQSDLSLATPSADLATADLHVPDPDRADLAYRDLACAALDCVRCGATCCCGSLSLCHHTADGDVCGGDCLWKDEACRASSECCSSICDPQSNTCVDIVAITDLAACCQGCSGDCVRQGGPCTSTCDCCPGTSCVIAAGYMSGNCQAL
jgi:hypothetical protein